MKLSENQEIILKYNSLRKKALSTTIINDSFILVPVLGSVQWSQHAYNLEEFIPCYNRGRVYRYRMI